MFLSIVVFIQDEVDKTIYQAELQSLSALSINQVTGIDELNSLNLNLYPNPATDQVTISFGRQIASAYQLKIYDRFGKLISNQAIPQGVQKITMDTQAYINGFYFIQIESPNEVITRKKLIIMKQ